MTTSKRLPVLIARLLGGVAIIGLLVTVAALAQTHRAEAQEPTATPRPLEPLTSTPAPLEPITSTVTPLQPIPSTITPLAPLPGTGYRVGLQVGHWRSWELPAELAGLRTSRGTSGGGRWEWELNLDIARRVATLLEAQGVEVDILPATIPPGYRADAFVAIHADGVSNRRLTGYKLARYRSSAIPETDDALLNALSEEYGKATGLPKDWNITRNMTGYYAFNSRRYRHAIAPTTPAVILEMGFMTNPSDLRLLLGRQEIVADGIVRGILRFLEVPDSSGG